MQWNSQSQKIKTLNRDEVGGLADMSGCFIYILLKNKEVIYIGQTKQIFSRIVTHLRDKSFDQFCIKSIKGSSHFLEAYLIFKFKPIFNYSIPSNERFICINHLTTVKNNSLNSKSFSVHIIGHTPYFDSREFNFLKFDKNRDRIPATPEEKIAYLELSLAHERLIFNK